MFKTLVIKNVALIESAEINFSLGLNVLSGETGSGKSVILEALNFVLGAKSDKTLIRSGEKECLVSAVFDIGESTEFKTLFDDADVEKEDEIVVSRKFSIDGKSSIKLNGVPVTQAMLKKFTAKLVDVHGQSEHFYLLKNSNQLELIDKFTENSDKLKKAIAERLSEYREIEKRLSEFGDSDADRLVKSDILTFQINEIESADIKDGEEEELTELKRVLSNQSKIISALSSVKNILSGDGGTGDVLGSACKIADSVAEFKDDYAKISERLYSVDAEISDISDSVSSILSDFEYSQADAEKTEERLDEIKTIKRKYGGSVQSVFEFLEKAKKQLEIYKNHTELTADLKRKKTEIESDIYGKYVELSKSRKIAARNFTLKVTEQLYELGMKDAVFDVQFNNFPDIKDCSFNSENGKDEIEFLFSANLGEPLKPLSSVISGGEISRFMLAVKTQTSKFNTVSTFIFDEIDTGISGNTAKIVAEKFAKIATDTQIIAITHLPQIAAMGDNNLLIEKSVKDGKTLTNVHLLDNGGKISEIVRLIGGESKSESAISLAKELIISSENYKGQLK